MRLIDADAFAVVTFKDKSEEFVKGAQYVLEMLDKQPTAYDVEKVEEKLKKAEKMMLPVIPTKDAIEIVRAGGKE